MYETIIVGTDGSRRALDAVRTAARLADLCGLDSLHVVTASLRLAAHEVARIQADLPKEYHDLVDAHLDAHDRFNEAKTFLSPGVTMVTHDMAGDPADAILAVAESVHADLIVVGARGLGVVERFVRGSVSTKVAHHSPCDVLIVEHDE